MGFFDLFNEEEANERETRREVRGERRVADTEFAAEDAHLDLREEELDIHKQRVETGDVVLHKDIIEEEQTVNVPVSHDQVVIEQRAVDHEPSDEPNTEEETVHIPVTSEKVDVDKHTVVTGEVSAHKRSVQETEQVHDVIHKEVAEVETHGDAEVIRED
ncbi:YsnF/AvaK domain-containing protein [Halalkalibacter krulwichiae]|uniref:Stress response protein YsnF n=1 Tax=Halalkalibacter krulwichiae TaxID=199441 RepID=A0A1X9MEV5_9BACI|nr:YsnF/AvaK domain-containing protein [Halalkalibacter krulwichiae]ARK31946.1 Stress response protein YsnF [Halalkalibacter krulwichiae]